MFCPYYSFENASCQLCIYLFSINDCDVKLKDILMLMNEIINIGVSAASYVLLDSVSAASYVLIDRHTK